MPTKRSHKEEHHLLQEVHIIEATAKEVAHGIVVVTDGSTR